MTQGKRVHEYPNGPRTCIANTVHSPIIQPFHRNASLCLSVRWDLSRPRHFPRSFFPFPQLGWVFKINNVTNYNFRKCIKFRKISVGWCLSQFLWKSSVKSHGFHAICCQHLGCPTCESPWRLVADATPVDFRTLRGELSRMKVIIAHPKHAKCGVIKTNKGMYNSMQNIDIYI